MGMQPKWTRRLGIAAIMGLSAWASIGCAEERDPINRYERLMTERGFIAPEAIEEMQHRINQEIDDAIQVAEKDPFPEPEDCLKGVYHEDM